MDSLNLDLIPALFPPNGITSNFVDPEENSYVPHIASFTLFALATIALAARVFTKVSIVRKLVWEDCKLPHAHPCVTNQKDSLITGYVCLLRVKFSKARHFEHIIDWLYSFRGLYTRLELPGWVPRPMEPQLNTNVSLSLGMSDGLDVRSPTHSVIVSKHYHHCLHALYAPGQIVGPLAISAHLRCYQKRPYLLVDNGSPSA